MLVKKYRVNVVTGNEKGCGTDANVFLTMHGEQGDSGERQLKNSETNRNKFERGQVTTLDSSSFIYSLRGFI